MLANYHAPLHILAFERTITDVRVTIVFIQGVALIAQATACQHLWRYTVYTYNPSMTWGEGGKLKICSTCARVLALPAGDNPSWLRLAGHNVEINQPWALIVKHHGWRALTARRRCELQVMTQIAGNAASMVVVSGACLPAATCAAQCIVEQAPAAVTAGQ